MQEIIDYIKKNLSKGYNSETLKWALINQGYSKALVERGIEQAHKELAKKAPVFKEKPMIKHEIIDEYNKTIEVKKPWWKKLLGI